MKQSLGKRDKKNSRDLGNYGKAVFPKDFKRTEPLLKSEITECNNIMALYPHSAAPVKPAQQADPQAGYSCVCFSDASASLHGVTMKL